MRTISKRREDQMIAELRQLQN